MLAAVRRLLLIVMAALLAGCPAGEPLPAPQVSISPSAPDADDELLLVIRPLGEGEGRAGLVWLITWRKDGTSVADLDGVREVPAERTAAGEAWLVTVRLQHGSELGPPGEASVVIRGDDVPPDDDDDVAPDDDDVAPDDDDSAASDDDDVAPDDDDATLDPCDEGWDAPVLDSFGQTLQCLPPGTFIMGSATDETGRDTDELEHTVQLTGHLLVGTWEVTADLYEEVTGLAPADCDTGCDPDQPVQMVTWAEAADFCNQLSVLEGLSTAYDLSADSPTWTPDRHGYRLLTEAEWEYAARAGEQAPFAGSDDVNDVAVCFTGGSAAAGTLAPNAFGLFDMSGNVSEWVWDRYGFYPLTGPDDPDVDPDGPAEGDTRVFRGGSWRGPAAACRVADRDHAADDAPDNSIGFRIARTVE